MESLMKSLKSLGYYSGVSLELKVEELLLNCNIKYLAQPNGSQKFPDFRLTDLNLDLECKSVANGSKPMWNCSYPKQDALYVISCKKFKECIVKFGKDIISQSISEIYEEYASRHKELELEINEKLSNVDNKLNFKVFAMNMYTQNKGFEISIRDSYKTKGIGQYFTKSKEILDSLLNDYTGTPRNVLEPSCGVGHILDLLKNLNVTALDIDQDVIDISSELVKNVNYITSDFLLFDFKVTFDLIIGNPPYFEIKKDKIPEWYPDSPGRCNIYYLFIYKCINLLEMGGELRFVIPSSFLSNNYAKVCRKYLLEKCQIIDIVIFGPNHFNGAMQNIVVLKCKRTNIPDNTKFVYGELLTTRTQVDSGVTIRDIGCSVKTGNIVWNKYKEYLSDTVGIKLWYSSCISEKIQTNKEKKKFLVVNQETIGKITKGPCIIVQRIVKDRLIYKLIISGEFFTENHVNVISGPLDNLRLLTRSFEDIRTSEFIKNVFKNNHISKSELESVLPVYIQT